MNEFIARDLDPLVDKYIVPGIKAMIEEEVRQIIEKAAYEAQERVNAILPKVLAEVGLRVSKTIQIDRFGQAIRIELVLGDKK